MRSMVGRWLADYHHNDRRHEERGHELGAARLHMGLFSGGLLWLAAAGGATDTFGWFYVALLT